MKALLTGASGRVGRGLQARGLEGWEILARDRQGLDIADADSVAEILDAQQVGLVINCAAYTQVDLAESERDQAWRVNVLGPRVLAKATGEREIPLLHFSTDYVFDGAQNVPYIEDDTVRPLSVYGETKREGEEEVRRWNPQHTLLRTAWLYDDAGPSFPHMALRLAQGERVRVAGDQYGSPTYVPHLLDGVEAVLKAGCIGTLHMAGAGVASRFEWIYALFQEMDVQTPLEAGETSEFPQEAIRPLYSALATGRPGVPQLPSWKEGVAAFAAAQS